MNSDGEGHAYQLLGAVKSCIDVGLGDSKNPAMEVQGYLGGRCVNILDSVRGFLAGRDGPLERVLRLRGTLIWKFSGSSFPNTLYP